MNLSLIAMGCLFLTADPQADAGKIKESLQGDWTLAKVVEGGKEIKKERFSLYMATTVTFANDKFIFMKKNSSIPSPDGTPTNPKERKVELSWNIDVSKKPFEIDMKHGDELVHKGIFELDGDSWRVILASERTIFGYQNGKELPPTKSFSRPTDFNWKEDPVKTFERIKK
jgi:uncharacterized protein (TIGR03067 family)